MNTDRTAGPARPAGPLRALLVPVLLVLAVALGACAPPPTTTSAADPAPVVTSTSSSPTSTAPPAPPAPTSVREAPTSVQEAPTSVPAKDPAAAPVAAPVAVSIPAIDVESDLVGVGLLPDGQMQTPDFGLAGWYTEGPRPGDPGPAVIAAHVDSYEGPDVFFRLSELAAGEEITVSRADGTSGTWVVQRSEQTDKDALPTASIWNDTDEPVLRLITCGGAFDRDIRSYEDNVVVYAVPATP